MKKLLLHYTGLVIFSLLALIAVLATVLPMFSFEAWYIRVFDYPRLQTMFIALMAMIFFMTVYFERKWQGYLSLGLLAIIVVIQAYKAFPYTPLAPRQVLKASGRAGGDSCLSLFISNVLQKNQAYHEVLAQIKNYQPDVIITTESNQAWEKGLSPLEKEYPYRVGIPQENTYGMHLYSRLPLDQSVIRNLIMPDIPSIRTRVQLRTGAWVHLFIVHPRPPVPGEDSDTRERDAEIILVGREARKVKGGVIVAGDFNDVAWSNTTELFQEVSGLLDPRRGRGFYNTFHAKIPVFRWPLDHIFQSRHFRLISIERVKSVGSDHFPMFIQLSYEPGLKEEQPVIKKEGNTDKKANETIREGKKDAGRNVP